MRKAKIGVLAVSLALSISYTAEAGDGGPLITLGDMDPIVAKLPIKESSDRVAQLEERLAKLSLNIGNAEEREGLNQAISLIKILRQTRITTTVASRVSSSITFETGMSVDHDNRVVQLIHPVNGRNRPGIVTLATR